VRVFVTVFMATLFFVAVNLRVFVVVVFTAGGLTVTTVDLVMAGDVTVICLEVSVSVLKRHGQQSS